MFTLISKRVLFPVKIWEGIRGAQFTFCCSEEVVVVEYSRVLDLSEEDEFPSNSAGREHFPIIAC
jgi:hypothetical protein